MTDDSRVSLSLGQRSSCERCPKGCKHNCPRCLKRLWLPAWAVAAQVALMVVLVGAVLVARGWG